MHVTVYTKPGCHLCEDVLQALDRLTRQYDLVINEVNILDDMAVYEEYRNIIPVVEVTSARVGRLVAPIEEAELQAYILMAWRVEKYGPTPSVLPKGREPFFDRVAHWIGMRWLVIMNTILGIFSGLPFVAPVFAALGWWSLANPIYTGYAISCHQLPERAIHIFGFEVAVCSRCSALYGGMFLFGLLYGLARSGRLPRLARFTQALPWWGLVLFLMPMAVDGLTHMFGLREGTGSLEDPVFGMFDVGSQAFGLNWWLRIFTGLLAAAGSIWFAFPRIQHSVDESEALLEMYRQSSRGGALRPAGEVS